jgi:proteasome beta subunit
MGGDRRATSGNLISHREMEKVVEADQFSGVAIAGAAGPAMEMVKLFQLQIEHYEKVEGVSLSLEGKANQLSMFVRSNLPAAMQGFMVVPIFAGYDHVTERGRLWDYDATGGRYEERDFVATGSGMLHAGAVLRMAWKRDLSTSAGGPDTTRGIFPTVAIITASGFARVGDDLLARVYQEIAEGVVRP